MIADYVEIDGKDYRIEWNWNTITNFLQTTGKELADIDRIAGMNPSDITRFVHCALVEGCRIDGVEFPFTVEQFGGLMEVADIPVVLEIYQGQIANKTSRMKAKKKEAEAVRS